MFQAQFNSILTPEELSASIELKQYVSYDYLNIINIQNYSRLSLFLHTLKYNTKKMTAEGQENKISVDKAIELLTTCSHEISACWNTFLKEEYPSDYAENRNDLVDVITLVDYIVGKLKEDRSDDFRVFFETVEQVLETGDDNAKELIIVGILEGLQNNCGLENLEYHNGFDKWLQPQTKKAWDGLIYLWESNDSIEEKQEKLKDFRI